MAIHLFLGSGLVFSWFLLDLDLIVTLEKVEKENNGRMTGLRKNIAKIKRN